MAMYSAPAVLETVSGVRCLNGVGGAVVPVSVRMDVQVEARARRPGGKVN